MKKAYFFDYHTADEYNVNIIDEKTLTAAESGKNYLNPDDYMFLGEYENIQEAKEAYNQMIWDEHFEKEAEKYHP